VLAAGVRWVAHPALSAALPLVGGPTTPSTDRQVSPRTGRWQALAGTLSVQSCCGVTGHHPGAPTPTTRFARFLCTGVCQRDECERGGAGSADRSIGGRVPAGARSLTKRRQISDSVSGRNRLHDPHQLNAPTRKSAVHTARLFARWHRAHSAWSDSEDAAAAWGVGRYLADQPSGRRRGAARFMHT
jgi:hypothetical protein